MEKEEVVIKRNVNVERTSIINMKVNTEFVKNNIKTQYLILITEIKKS